MIVDSVATAPPMASATRTPNPPRRPTLNAFWIFTAVPSSLLRRVSAWEAGRGRCAIVSALAGDLLRLGEHGVQTLEVARDCFALNPNLGESFFRVLDKLRRALLRFAHHGLGSCFGVREDLGRLGIRLLARGLGFSSRLALDRLGLMPLLCRAAVRLGQLQLCVVQVFLGLSHGLLVPGERLLLRLVTAGLELDLEVEATLFRVAFQRRAGFVEVVLDLCAHLFGFPGQFRSARLDLTLEIGALLLDLLRDARAFRGDLSVECRSRLGCLELEFRARSGLLLFEFDLARFDLPREVGALLLDVAREIAPLLLGLARELRATLLGLPRERGRLLSRLAHLAA